jgi:hypothetical protein
VDLVSEADERLPSGPRGEQGRTGRTGERGERGLSRLQGRAVVFLFALAVVLAGYGLVSNSHEIAANNHKFCQVIRAATATPVQKPANPAANPSREQAFEWYQRYRDLGRSLGC